MNSKPTYEELEHQIAELKRQNETILLDFVFQNQENEKRVGELIAVNKELAINNQKVSINAKETEAKHKFLFDNTIQGVVYQNSQGEINYANPAAERILGLTLSQMQGRTSIDPRWKAIHEDGSDFPGETHPAAVTLRTGKPVYNVTMGVFNPLTDNYHWINVNSIPRFRDTTEKPYEVIATFEDITERKWAEKKLQESNEEIAAQNEEYQQINEELRQTNEKLFSAKEKIEENSIHLHLKNEEYASINEELRQNISELADTKEKLEISESSFRNIFEENQAVMLLIDTVDGHIINANNAAARFYGYSRDAMCQMKINHYELKARSIKTAG